MKPTRGRPKIIRTGKPGRPAKRKHEIPVVETQENVSESEEDAILANVENHEENGDKVINLKGYEAIFYRRIC